ncbi:hypothetical protein KBZ15_17975 [Cyanobium sp. BA20m-p-22]|uniref:hypothetical protein n=1 Tax=Cyanobium sp. BA20m-p-22 TaxID=2823704 RepID=UPI0020CD9F30|nr:hypothetical protein [Cyanobium sp. BA20m-p-22]MCP9911774.1 hypothetical protein [Cyanobium sp. BA20m-p-22]
MGDAEPLQGQQPSLVGADEPLTSLQLEASVLGRFPQGIPHGRGGATIDEKDRRPRRHRMQESLN